MATNPTPNNTDLFKTMIELLGNPNSSTSDPTVGKSALPAPVGGKPTVALPSNNTDLFNTMIGMLPAAPPPSVDPGLLASLAAGNPSFSDPQVAKLYAQNQAMINKIINLGGTPSHHHPNLFHQLIDVLSRPAYAVGDAILQEKKSVYNGEGAGENILRTLGGVVHGLSGTHKTLIPEINQRTRDQDFERKQAEQAYQNYINSNGLEDTRSVRSNFASRNGMHINDAGDFLGRPVQNIGEGGGTDVLGRIMEGFGGAIADPLTYVGGGLVTDVAKGAKAAINSGRIEKELAPVVEQLQSVGALDKDVPVSELIKKFTGPQEGVPMGVPSVVTTKGVRQLKEIADNAQRFIHQHSFDLAAEQAAKDGRPLLQEKDLPPIVYHSDFSDPEAVQSRFNLYTHQRAKQELRTGQAHPIEYPNGIRSNSIEGGAKLLRKKLATATDDEREALLRNPKTGKNMLKEGAKSIADVYRRQFALLNDGAKSIEEATIKQAARNAELASPKMAEAIKTAHLEHAKETVLSQVAAPLAKVKAMAEYIGRDMDKLEQIIPVGTKAGAFNSHLGSLSKYLERAKNEVKRALTPEETAKLTDHWWNTAYRTAATVMEKVADHNFAPGAENLAKRADRKGPGDLARDMHITKAANDALKGRYKLKPGASTEAQQAQRNAIMRVKHFAGVEHDTVLNVRRRLAQEAATDARPAKDVVTEARAKAAGEKLLKLDDFMPKKADSTAFEAAKLANEANKVKIGETAAAHADLMFQGIKEALEAATMQSFAPEMVRTFAVRFGLGKDMSIELMRSPEFLSKFISQFLSGDGRVRDALHAFQKAFISTGTMTPEIAALKNSSAGRVHQMVKFTIQRLDKEFGKISKEDVLRTFNDWLNNRSTDAEMNAIFDQHLQELTNVLRNPEMRLMGVRLNKINGYLPKGSQLDLPKMNVVEASLANEVHAKYMLKKAIRGFIESGSDKKDPKTWLLNLHLAMDRAVTNATVLDTTIKSWGVPLKNPFTGEASEAVESLIHNRGYTTLSKIADKSKSGKGVIPPVLNKYVFQPEIAHDLYRMFELLHDNRQVEEFSNIVFKGLQPWKAAVTVYNIPSYQTRNAFQNTIMHWLALRTINSNPVSMMKSYQIAAKMAHKINPALKTTLSPLNRALHRPVGESDTSKRLFENKNALGRKWRDVRSGYISDDVLHGAYLQHGLDNGFISNQFGNEAKLAGRIANFGPGKANLHNLNRLVTNASQGIENYYRYALFIDAIRNSTKQTFEEATQEAAHAVRKYLFDYHDLTGFEKTAMVNLIPFYKWMRKAIPVMTETMFTQPSKVLNPLILQREASLAAGGSFDPNDPWKADVDKVVPSWIADTMQFPLGKHAGNTIYSSAALPFNDVGQTITSVDQLEGMLNPIGRVPIELHTGKQLYHNIPIKNKLEYATLGQLPQTSKITSTLASIKSPGATVKNTTLLTLLKQLGITQSTENTPKSQISQLTADLQKHQIQHKALVRKLTGG